MEEIKKIIDGFVRAEAEALSLKESPDSEKYNEAVRTLYSYTAPAMKGKLGVIEKSEIDLIMANSVGSLIGNPAGREKTVIPRHIYKISRYKHEKYGVVWAVFVSLSDPSPETRYLEMALFVSENEGEKKVVGTSLYTDARTDGELYRWEHNEGYPDLVFEALTGPEKIERYREPFEDFDGLKLYQENI